MSPIGASRVSPIGIDLGARRIKAAQLRRARGQWRLEALGRFDRTDGGALNVDHVQQLRSVLQRQGFLNRPLVLSAAWNKLLAGILELPSAGADRSRDQIARVELARMHKVPPASFEMSYWDLPAGRHGRGTAQVIAVGYPHEQADRVLDAFASAGLDVQAIEDPSCATVRACRSMLAPQPGATAILDLGYDQARLMIVCQETVIYERLLGRFGLSVLLDRLCETFGCDPATASSLIKTVGIDQSNAEQDDADLFEELTTLIRRHLDAIAAELPAPFEYVANQYGQAARRVLLVGGCASNPGWAAYLDAKFEQEVLTAAPSNLAACDTNVLDKATDAGLTTAVGLAMFGQEP